jgi:hypothetical protein
MPEHERKLMHLRLNHQSVETLKHALHVTGLHTNQEVIDEALKLYNMVLSGEFDRSKEEIMSNALADVKRVERLEEWASSDKVVVKQVVREVAPPVVAAEPEPDYSFAQYSRDDMLARCKDTDPSKILDWAKNWKGELAEVGWTPNEFAKAKLEWNRVNLKVKAPVAEAAVPAKGQSDAQFRIEALARRLKNIASGDKNMAHFSKDFEHVRALGINNGQLESFKDAVIKMFSSQVEGMLRAKTIQPNAVEGTLALFEDAWFREFELSDEQKEGTRMRVGV